MCCYRIIFVEYQFPIILEHLFRNNASAPLQYVAPLQTPFPVQNFMPPMQHGLSLPTTQNRFILPKQNTIFINTGNLYQESIPSFDVSQTSLRLNEEELPTNTISSATTCKVEVKSECSSTDDSDITLQAHNECFRPKTFPHSPIKVKEEIKVEESFGTDDTNMQTSEWKVHNENLLFVKEEKAAAIDIKEENFENDFHTNEHMSLSDPLDCTGFNEKVEDIEIEEENIEDTFQLDNLSSNFNTFESPLRTDLEKICEKKGSRPCTEREDCRSV
ncbi:hypothetical protein Avbf_08949 [Armadillidium vulgare]|nr:hypothetical protein Avbf_08949 [Armadillidium vulgare]